jgi:hypothetical protein
LAISQEGLIGEKASVAFLATRPHLAEIGCFRSFRPVNAVEWNTRERQFSCISDAADCRCGPVFRAVGRWGGINLTESLYTE